MQQYPMVGRRDIPFLTDFFGFHAGHLAQAENLGHHRLQAVGAFVQHAPQLAYKKKKIGQKGMAFLSSFRPL